MWLGWNDAQRLSFAQGFLAGYKSGKTNGCRAVSSLLSIDVPKTQKDPTHEDPTALCESKAGSFSMGPDQYVSGVSKFYQEFPDDRDFPITTIFALLSDSSHETPEQFHYRVSHNKRHSE